MPPVSNFKASAQSSTGSHLKMDPSSMFQDIASQGPVSERNMTLHPRDIHPILKARLETSLVVDMYLLKLPNNPCEKVQRPGSPPPRILYRLRPDGLWVYHIYTAKMVPHPSIGARGDVWIDTTHGTGCVWFCGPTDVWTPWNHTGCKDDSAHVGHGSSGTRHPWIPGVCLQFTGSGVSWHSHSFREKHRLLWESSCDQKVLYDELFPNYPAQLDRHLWKVAKSRRMFPPAPQLNEVVWSARLRALGRAGNMVNKAPPTRLALGDITNKVCSSVTPSSASSAASAKVGVSHSAVTQDSVNRKEVQENPLKRPLEALPDASSGSVQPSKRTRIKREQDTSDLLPIPEGQASNSEEGLSALLQGLRIPLDHRSDVLARFGILSLEDFRRLAYARQSRQEEMFHWLRMEGGFSLAETLSLRLGLKAFRDTRISLTAPSLRMLFAQVDPEMASCLPVFDELGIGLEHLTLLSELDSYSYGVFEWELQMRGISRKVLGMLWNTLRTGRLWTYADWRRSDGAP
ncbi:hypothetical protein C8Q78DRAFT_1076768 [Trametes maxima]|nr:hypothetical protein C8Q78DRAFT_1076768 [Trametes maxima]